MMSVLEALQDREPYLDGYGYGTYPAAYAAYAEKFAPLFSQAVQESDDISELAERLLDELAEDVKKQSIFARGRVRGDQKMILAVYLSPMLLASPESKCRELAQTLCDQWKKRYPKDAYCLAKYERIAGGFHRKILGFRIEESTDKE